ncbi:MAG: Ribosomal RNA large subunit methyltransferase H [Bacteroidetes bacterium ADurb.Bin408]|nr:MAG: Ribosomal RNA large subunit methyltransferase H [Bacteroidetes bacterium ADurb.Bin408]
MLLKHLQQSDIVVLLDEKGRNLTSKEFASFIESCSVQSVKNLVFVVGGAYGFSEKIYELAHHKIALSKMTFTHQMVRLIFVEQLYRGLAIIRNLPYHNP